MLNREYRLNEAELKRLNRIKSVARKPAELLGPPRQRARLSSILNQTEILLPLPAKTMPALQTTPVEEHE